MKPEPTPTKSRKKKFKDVVLNRTLRIISAKKDELKGCMIIVSPAVPLLGNPGGPVSTSGVVKACEAMDKIQPDAVYVVHDGVYNIQVVDVSEYKGKDVVVTCSFSDALSEDEVTAYKKRIEQDIKRVMKAKSITFLHYGDAQVEFRSP